jgi:hypothetical protein
VSDIDDGFSKMLDGLKLADEGRNEVLHGLEEVWVARKDLHNTEMRDLRETIDEFQRALIQELRQLTRHMADLREMRQRLDGEQRDQA